MSRYTYAGPFTNPTANWFVKETPEGFRIFVREERASDGSAGPDRPHTSAPTFDDPDEAQEYIDAQSEFFEEDYSDYLDEFGARDEMYQRHMEEY